MCYFAQSIKSLAIMESRMKPNPHVCQAGRPVSALYHHSDFYSKSGSSCSEFIAEYLTTKQLQALYSCLKSFGISNMIQSCHFSLFYLPYMQQTEIDRTLGNTTSGLAKQEWRTPACNIIDQELQGPPSENNGCLK